MCLWSVRRPSRRMPAMNPTGTVGALAYWAAEAIRDRYLKDAGPLVPV